ncbi:MAG: leucyl/phenylalanyl-tRNA--protein transferase [Legionellaceae bacterium]|nr:leucyl/phenylalanyl-tRNA--protein transferase [Legionellaceae bacterium]
MRAQGTEPDDYYFPAAERADKQGLLAIGGDLAPTRILAAYHRGIFPWFEPGCPVLWWCPDPRLVLYPQDFKCHRSLRQSLQKSYQLTVDTAFAEVIHLCATANQRENQTWISSAMQHSYCQLHEMGYAHSVEVWREEKLIGGLYGLALGQAFFGESMFHLAPDASKIALYELCQLAQKWQFHFIDCQLPNAHLQRLGAVLLPRKAFLYRLQQSLAHPTHIGKWRLTLC